MIAQQVVHSATLRHRLAKPFAVFSLVGALLCPYPLHAQTPGEVPVGGLLPDARLHGLNGPDRSLAAYRGKPLIINVWASWCGPCRQEMASLERLAWSKEGERFAVLGISTDDSPAAAHAFLKRTNATFSHFIDHQLKMENLLGANRLPLTVLVDKRGKILKKIYGAQEWDSEAAIRQIRSTFGEVAKAETR